jgi:hypothetical protein
LITLLTIWQAQLKHIIQFPYDALVISAMTSLEAASIRLVAEINLPGILGDNDEGLSIQEIEKRTGVDGGKLGKFFCFLCYLTLIGPPTGRTRLANVNRSRLVP